MAWTKIAEYPVESNLQQLHDYLQSQNVQHRITEQAGLQVLWLANPAQVSLVNTFFSTDSKAELFRAGKPVVETGAEKGGGQTVRPSQLTFAQMLRLFPLTLVIIVLGVLGYLIASVLNVASLESALRFLPFQVSVSKGEIWRLLTPTFLHYGSLHILFNSLWVWEFGRRIEVFAGKRGYLITFLIIAIAANFSQFFAISGNLFGGLSGVVYGFMGYLLVWGRFHKSPLVKMPSSIYIFFLVWLALGYSGLIDLFISGSVGNAAHLGGLIAGLIVATAEVLYFKHKVKPK